MTFCEKIFRCVSLLEEFDDDLSGLAGGFTVGEYTWFIAGAGHDGRVHGDIVRLPSQ